jgi:hypothetical protein
MRHTLIGQGLHHHFGAGHDLRHLPFHLFSYRPDSVWASRRQGRVVTKREIKKAPCGTRIKRQLQVTGSVPACFWRLRYYDEHFGHAFHSPAN